MENKLWPNGNFIKCPCCGREWDINRHNACQCGATIGPSPKDGKPIVIPSSPPPVGQTVQGTREGFKVKDEENMTDFEKAYLYAQGMVDHSQTNREFWKGYLDALRVAREWIEDLEQGVGGREEVLQKEIEDYRQALSFIKRNAASPDIRDTAKEALARYPLPASSPSSQEPEGGERLKYFIEDLRTHKWLSIHFEEYVHSSKYGVLSGGDDSKWTNDPNWALAFNTKKEAQEFYDKFYATMPDYAVTEHEFTQSPHKDEPKELDRVIESVAGKNIAEMAISAIKKSSKKRHRLL